MEFSGFIKKTCKSLRMKEQIMFFKHMLQLTMGLMPNF